MAEYSVTAARLNAVASRLEAVLGATDRQLWPRSFSKEPSDVSERPTILPYEPTADDPQVPGGPIGRPFAYFVGAEPPAAHGKTPSEAGRFAADEAGKHWPIPLVIVGDEQAEATGVDHLLSARSRLANAEYRIALAQRHIAQEIAATLAIEKLLAIPPNVSTENKGGQVAIAVSEGLSVDCSLDTNSKNDPLPQSCGEPIKQTDQSADVFAEDGPIIAQQASTVFPPARFEDFDRAMTRAIRERFQESGPVSREIAETLGALQPVAEDNLFVLSEDQLEHAAGVARGKMQVATREFREHMALFAADAKKNLQNHNIILEAMLHSAEEDRNGEARLEAEAIELPPSNSKIKLDVTMPVAQIEAVSERLKKQLVEARGKRFTHQRRQLVQWYVLLPAAMRYPTQFILPLSLLFGALALGAPASNAGIRRELLTYSLLLFPLLYCAALAVAIRDARAERAAFAEIAKVNLMAEIDRACVTVGAILEDKYAGSLRQAAKDLHAQIQESTRKNLEEKRKKQEHDRVARDEERRKIDQQSAKEAEIIRKREKAEIEASRASKKLSEEAETKQRREAELRRRQLLDAETQRRLALEKLNKSCSDALALAKQVLMRAQQEIEPNVAAFVLAKVGG